ncbi:hypothetical protein B0T14DRAFT_545559 [Immersiella caudata]|uniref:DUF1996 domain-containing protein n=1 Tax=Immersiella caudata TaxID=314043 RepID=A0AA40BZI4_9PEZI|nr:hypothetical protein B0T14DRAFT_545559 [Immersiella caudata]
MHIPTLTTLALAAVPATALLRFGCSQLTIDRVDPLVNPGVSPSPHLHRFSEDFSNCWTAVFFFRARNGGYHRVPIVPNLGFEGSKGGMTVYHMQEGLTNYAQTSKVTAFWPGFKQLVGEASYRTKEQAKRLRQIMYTCLDAMSTRHPETLNLPTRPCEAGIMANLRFPTCWDGKSLDSPDHMAHMAYPETGTFKSGGPCPASHTVRVPQLMYETIWDTRMFNDKEMWPEDGSQPFVWSMNDQTGYGSHGDYIFGGLDDSLPKVMDTPCYVNCPTLKTQTIQKGNECSVNLDFKEPIDSWLDDIPGMPETAAS